MANITSGPGIGGQTWYYKDGEFIGWSAPGLLGETLYYDRYDRYVGESVNGLLGTTLYADRRGKHLGTGTDIHGATVYEDSSGDNAGMSVDVSDDFRVYEGKDSKRHGLLGRLFGLDADE